MWRISPAANVSKAVRKTANIGRNNAEAAKQDADDQPDNVEDVERKVGGVDEKEEAQDVGYDEDRGQERLRQARYQREDDKYYAYAYDGGRNERQRGYEGRQELRSLVEKED